MEAIDGVVLLRRLGEHGWIEQVATDHERGFVGEMLASAPAQRTGVFGPVHDAVAAAWTTLRRTRDLNRQAGLSPRDDLAPASTRSRRNGSNRAGVAAMVKSPDGAPPSRSPVRAPASVAMRAPAAKSQG